jgi:hypothetical protein
MAESCQPGDTTTARPGLGLGGQHAMIVNYANTVEEVEGMAMRKPMGKCGIWNKITFSDGTSH